MFTADVVEIFMDALRPEEAVLGGGNVKKIKELPLNCRAGENADTCVFGSHEHACRKRTHQR
jgi:polyphosphate glucokinase